MLAESPMPVTKAIFKGPLFIVGLPRSGTKLLRDLMNRHPQINIPVSESQFLTWFLNKYGDPSPFKKAEDLKPFLQQFYNTKFYLNMTSAGFHFHEASFLKTVDPKSWVSIFEHLYKNTLQIDPANKDVIWGDKTPTYVHHMPLLKSVFPSAKFVHIIRDPRDNCLSMRKTYGKDILRTATIWTKGILEAHDSAADFPEDYIELHYEDLLENPENTLRSISDFMGIDFDERMLELERPSENLGDAKGESKIVAHNKFKFEQEFTKDEIQKIEEVAFPALNVLHYLILHAKEHKPLSRNNLKIRKMGDGIRAVQFHIKDKGLYTGLKYYIKLRRFKPEI